MSSVNQLRRGTTCHARQKALFAYFASAEFSCHLELGWQLPAYVFMRDLVLSGGPWSNGERQAILEYCESDVVALDKLFPQLLSDVMRGPDPSQRLGQALLRGRAMKATACMEYNGVPIDTETLARLRNGWTDIQDKLIADIDKDFGVFDGRTFKRDRFTQWLIKNRIAWPTTETG